jgi:uncharacterized membrane protein YkoI
MMRTMTRKLTAAILTAAALVLALPASVRADGDHDRARRAREAGEIAGLDRLLAEVARNDPGKVIDVELDRDQGRYVYEIVLIAPDGRRRKVKYDARSLERLERHGR